MSKKEENGLAFWEHMFYTVLKGFRQEGGAIMVADDRQRKNDLGEEGLLQEGIHISFEEEKLLQAAADPLIRPSLLDRLQELELLSEFLAAESGTT